MQFLRNTSHKKCFEFVGTIEQISTTILLGFQNKEVLFINESIIFILQGISKSPLLYFLGILKDKMFLQITKIKGFKSIFLMSCCMLILIVFPAALLLVVEVLSCGILHSLHFHLHDLAFSNVRSRFFLCVQRFDTQPCQAIYTFEIFKVAHSLWLC